MLFVYAPAALAYMLWLAGSIDWSGLLGPLLYAVMLFNVVTTTLFLWITRRIDDPVPRATNLDRSVDALITTSNEPLAIVEQTIRGALAVRGIGAVHVLDDGARIELEMLTARLGAVYHARGSRLHAKAGNLNFGLEFTDAAFLLILDADHVPKPEFLERTLGYLDDRSLAVVQTPQTYHNDSFLHRRTRRGPWSEQDMFYRCIQPAKNRSNAAFFVGTSAVLRRSAIDDVGGFATATATEDIHTAVRMHARGWKSIFVSEVLASGLEVESLRELYQQRRRWAAGSMGLLLRSPDSPLRVSGLTMSQRVNYIVSMVGHQQGTLRLCFQLLPIACSLTLTAPFFIGPGAFIAVTGAFIALTWIAVTLHARGTFHIVHTEANLLAMGFSNVAGLLGTFLPHERFRPARKNARHDERTFVKLALWGLLVLGVAALIRDVEVIVGDSEPSRPLAIGCVVFVVLNLVVLLDFLLPLHAYERRGRAVAPLSGSAYGHDDAGRPRAAPVRERATPHPRPDGVVPGALHDDLPVGRRQTVDDLA